MTVPSTRGSDNATTALAGVVFVVSVTALVVLEVMGKSTTALMVLVGPVVGGLVVAGGVNKRTAEVHDTVRRVEQQTNGVLDERIARQTESSVRRVLTETGVVGAQPAPVTVNVPPPAIAPPTA